MSDKSSLTLEEDLSRDTFGFEVAASGGENTLTAEINLPNDLNGKFRAIGLLKSS